MTDVKIADGGECVVRLSEAEERAERQAKARQERIDWVAWCDAVSGFECVSRKEVGA